MTRRKAAPDIGDVVEVSWVDIETIDGSGVTTEAVLAVEPMMCTSWGEYAGDTEDYMVLIHNKFNHEKGSPDYIRIVKGAIKSIAILKRKGKKAGKRAA